MAELTPGEVLKVEPKKEVRKIMDSITEALEGKWKAGPAPTVAVPYPPKDLCYWVGQGNDDKKRPVIISAEHSELEAPDASVLHVTITDQNDGDSIILDFWHRKEWEDVAQINWGGISKWGMSQGTENTPRTLELAKNIRDILIKIVRSEEKEKKTTSSEKNRTENRKIVDSVLETLEELWVIQQFVDPDDKNKLVDIKYWEDNDLDGTGDFIRAIYTPKTSNEDSQLILVCESGKFTGTLILNWQSSREGADLEILETKKNKIKDVVRRFDSLKKAQYVLSIVHNFAQSQS